jgi:transposase-like protein
MNNKCPNSNGNYHMQKTFIIKKGFFRRSSDSRRIQRFKCKACDVKFSNATFSDALYQKKRRSNFLIYKLISSGISLRRIAKILNLHQDTVRRKVEFLSLITKRKQEKLLKKMHEKVSHLQIDDLITIEHTKLKPVIISFAMDSKT